MPLKGLYNARTRLEALQKRGRVFSFYAQKTIDDTDGLYLLVEPEDAEVCIELMRGSFEDGPVQIEVIMDPDIEDDDGDDVDVHCRNVILDNDFPGTVTADPTDVSGGDVVGKGKVYKEEAVGGRKIGLTIEPGIPWLTSKPFALEFTTSNASDIEATVSVLLSAETTE